ncbi:MAG: hypothetical protein RL215_1145 [Planctomycetota bacterium]|jgi:predicted nucleotidyltransferase
MASLLQHCTHRGLIRPPAFLPSNMLYETRMGSIAYGVSIETSDCDIYGVSIPPRDHLFPHLAGEIAGFGSPIARFEIYQRHHVRDADAQGGRGCEYDFNIYSLPRYFTLCMQCNPNLIDSLFTAQECITHLTRVGSMIRERRSVFLHKGVWVRFKAYAYSQLHKMQSKNPQGKRAELRDQFGFDVKFAYHLVRLLYECEQLLMYGELDLRRDREHLKAIRRGELTEADIRAWAAAKEKQLESLYLQSRLPDGPDQSAIRRLLLECIEEHYGCIDQIIPQPDAATDALREIAAAVDRWRRTMSPGVSAEDSN